MVQLYVRDDVASVARPIQELLGFGRVWLEPGETARMLFTVDPSRLAFHDASMRLVTEPGGFTFGVAASSADIRSSDSIYLEGKVAEFRRPEIVDTLVKIG